MKNRFKYNSIIIAFSILTTLVSCKDDWEEHYEQIDARLDSDILTVLAQDDDYSEFLGYLKETHIDSVLMASQAYTVWAPTNEAFASVPTEILEDEDLLKSLIENHVGRNSYTSGSFEDLVLVKMFNGKYLDFNKTTGSLTFGGVEMLENDILTSNGVVHKIKSTIEVRDNIWSYLKDNTERFPYQISYLEQFNQEAFDEDASTPISINSLGQTVYDSIFKESNTFFDIIGDLNSEETRFSFIGLTDEVYTQLYTNLEGYFAHKIADSTQLAIDRIIFNNVNFPLIDPIEIDGVEIDTTTTLNRVVISPPTDIETFSNGNVLEVNEFVLDPKEIFYKPSRYEVENTVRREIGSTVDLTIQSVFDETASGRFTNIVSMLNDPNSTNTNNNFEVSFHNVYAAAYNVKVKFSPVSNDDEPTKLRFELTYNNLNGSEVVEEIESIIVEADEERDIQIGGDYLFNAFVDESENNIYNVKLKVIVDVNNAELALYNRRFGIDYIELVPVEEVTDTETED